MMSLKKNFSMRSHLRDRHVIPSLYKNSIVIDEENRVITFLLWNFSGQLVGYQQYRPDNHEKAVKNHPDKRYYLFLGDEGGDIQNRSKRRLGIFGIETLKMFNKGPVLLVEGVFDACRLHTQGYAALGLLTANPKKSRSLLTTIHRPLISICDGDPEGRKLAKYGDHAIYLEDGLDVGDLTEFEFEALIKQIEDVGHKKSHQP